MRDHGFISVSPSLISIGRERGVRLEVPNADGARIAVAPKAAAAPQAPAPLDPTPARRKWEAMEE